MLLHPTMRFVTGGTGAEFENPTAAANRPSHHATPSARPPPFTLPCRMKPGQKSIYYMAADSVEAARAAPFVEALVARGTEVLYLTEPIDEACVTNLAKFADCELVDVSKEGVTVDEDGGCGRGGCGLALCGYDWVWWADVGKEGVIVGEDGGYWGWRRVHVPPWSGLACGVRAGGFC